MIFSNEDIKAALKKGTIKISPLKPDQIGPASVDLTLADEWYVFKKWRFVAQHVDLRVKRWQDVVQPKKAAYMTLKPGEICLGKTMERITLAPNILGTLEGRSQYARMGLSIHITSALVQPGSDNRQVLEIGNMAPFSITLHAGMRVSQVVFMELKTPSSKPYAKFGKIAINQ